MERIEYSATERLQPAEYLAFLRRSDLGRMYPGKDLEQRLPRLLEHTGVTITAGCQSELVGVCLGVTDRTYLLFITDIGAAHGYERRGVGRQLLGLAHEAVDGPDEITHRQLVQRRGNAVLRRQQAVPPGGTGWTGGGGMGTIRCRRAGLTGRRDLSACAP